MSCVWLATFGAAMVVLRVMCWGVLPKKFAANYDISNFSLANFC